LLTMFGDICIIGVKLSTNFRHRMTKYTKPRLFTADLKKKLVILYTRGYRATERSKTNITCCGLLARQVHGNICVGFADVHDAHVTQILRANLCTMCVIM
jgi:hypothetical protein